MLFVCYVFMRWLVVVVCFSLPLSWFVIAVMLFVCLLFLVCVFCLLGVVLLVAVSLVRRACMCCCCGGVLGVAFLLWFE